MENYVSFYLFRYKNYFLFKWQSVIATTAAVIAIIEPFTGASAAQ